MTEKLVIIGNGMAPGRMLEHLLEAAPGRYSRHHLQRRAARQLRPHHAVAGAVGREGLRGDRHPRRRLVHQATASRCTRATRSSAIDRAAKTVTSDHGVAAPYDKLVIATGSVPFIMPVPGNDLPGVLTYRDLDDVNAMLLAAQSRAKAVVIGGGLLGLEAAAGLRMRGMDVTVLHVMPTLMERQLDPAAGYLLQRAVEARGIKVMTKANTKAIVGNGKGRGRRAGRRHGDTGHAGRHGGRHPAEFRAWRRTPASRSTAASSSMPACAPAIRTSIALGECAEVDGQVYGLVAPLYEMARVAAGQLAGDAAAAFVHIDTPTKLKVTGIDLFSLGDFADGDDRQEIVLRDASAGVYKRLVLKDDRIIGTVLYGETADGAWFNDLKKKATDISEMRDTLIFGQAYQGGAPLDPMAAVAALPDDAEICGCNGVCKGKIIGAIAAKGLTSLDDVRAHTKASASCGSCTGLVEQLLKLTLGDAYNPAAVQPMCPCTTLGHDDVRRLIKAKRLKTIPAVMQELEWKTSCGCAKCRPALNYYLVCRLARRICRRLPVALHQRARPRQHPEGRHLFGGAAHVGRRDQRRRNCAPSPMSSTSSRSRWSR